MLLVFNPVAGKGEFVNNMFSVVNSFTKAGYEVTVHPTLGEKDAYHKVLARAKDFDCVVCSGGDGTLNETINALIQLENQPPLGYIPSGTSNDFANSHNIACDIFACVDVILTGAAQPIDIGKFNGKYFSYIAAFGLFTDVAYGTPQSLKNIFGHTAYIFEGARKLTNITDYHCKITCDDEVLEDDFVFGMISNAKLAGGIKLPREMQVELDDGEFEMLLLHRMNSFQESQQAVAALLGNGKVSDIFTVRKGRSFKIETKEPLSWTIDGEFGGTFTNTDISVLHKAIKILKPEDIV